MQSIFLHKIVILLHYAEKTKISSLFKFDIDPFEKRTKIKCPFFKNQVRFIFPL